MLQSFPFELELTWSLSLASQLSDIDESQWAGKCLSQSFVASPLSRAIHVAHICHWPKSSPSLYLSLPSFIFSQCCTTSLLFFIQAIFEEGGFLVHKLSLCYWNSNLRLLVCKLVPFSTGLDLVGSQLLNYQCLLF